MKLCNSVKYTSHKCELFNYCYMRFVFELAYKLNISVDGHNCRNMVGTRGTCPPTFSDGGT